MHKGDVFIKYLLAYLYLIRRVVNFIKSRIIDRSLEYLYYANRVSI